MLSDSVCRFHLPGVSKSKLIIGQHINSAPIIITHLFNAMRVWEEGKDFLQELLADKDVVKALGENQIREKFDLGYHTKHVDTIFERVFG